MDMEMDGCILTLYFQSYVDDQLISTNMIKNAVIAGHDGNIWASSSGFNVSPSFLPQMPLVSKSAKILGREESILRGRVLIFDELTSPLGLLLRPLLWEKCETEKGHELNSR